MLNFILRNPAKNIYEIAGFCALIIVSLNLNFAFAYSPQVSGTWTQSDWSGGNGQANWSDITKFSSSNLVNNSNSGSLTLQSANIPVSDWYNQSWGYRKQVTIDGTKITGNLTNFTVLISINADSDLAAKAKSNGDDIFFTDSDGVTKLNHEIESYNNGTGRLIAWVKVPSLSLNTNKTLFLYYGNSGAANQQNPTAAWDSSYKGVYHLSDTPTGSAGDIKDSTGQFNGTSSGLNSAQTAGKIGGSLTWSGSGLINTGNINYYTNYTIEAWVNPNAGGCCGRLVDKGDAGNDSLSIYWDVYGLGTTLYYQRVLSGGAPHYGAGGLPAQNVYSYFAATFPDDGSTANIYINGVSQSIDTPETGTGTVQNNSIGYIIGNRLSGNRTFPGNIDEFRISNVQRSASWISTQYNNQNSPSTFITVASEVISTTSGYETSGSLTSSIFDSTQNSDWGNLNFNVTIPSNTSAAIKVRTGNNSDLSDATAFGSCTAISSNTDISSNSCVNDSDRYIQYEVTLGSTDGISSPTLLDISIDYSLTPTPTPTATPTATPSPTATATPTSTPTATSTISPTSSTTPTITNSPTSTPSVASTASATPTISITSTSTPIPTEIEPTATLTSTPTVSPTITFITSQNTQFTDNSIEIKGKTTPNTKLKIEISSNNVVYITETIESNSKGEWTYKNISIGSGEYKLVASTSENGSIITKALNFSVKDTKVNPKEQNNTWIYLLILFITTALIIILYIYKRRKNKWQTQN